ncbi:hypothetical protein BCR34DRAFT_384222 [Clohesyomyces aquaticus]|uniref:F-box domain-containing protein n=1 Tax=Clohesyomyces aquaticus TaxID=1231657 RepID=A0A1Y1ZFS4_9PLEO|nr:hypothetical protein BCR34DRAFT_384222 [Clohesyomyces aquaticus]
MCEVFTRSLNSAALANLKDLRKVTFVDNSPPQESNLVQGVDRDDYTGDEEYLPLLLTPSLCSLEICADENECGQKFLPAFFNSTPNLHRICLDTIDVEKLSKQWLKLRNALFSPLKSMEGHPSLKELVLRNVRFRTSADTFVQMFDFLSLSSLTLQWCAQVIGLFDHLLRIQANQTCQWKHLAVNLGTIDTFERFESVISMLTACPTLSSIHITSIDLSKDVMIQVWPQLLQFCRENENIISFSIHFRHSDHRPNDFGEDQFEEICGSLPRLRQLGIQFSEYMLPWASPQKVYVSLGLTNSVPSR